jgi:hypothetical protein
MMVGWVATDSEHATSKRARRKKLAKDFIFAQKG